MSPTLRGENYSLQKAKCIVCRCFSADDYYNIFIVDLEGEINAVDELKFIRRDPALPINSETFRVAAFCVLDSKLYMFEGYDERHNPHGKSVFTFDLSSPDVLTTFNLKLEKRMLDKARPMLCTKKFPAAVPTSDGKILVFSSRIKFGKYDKQIGFELYDPHTDLWSELPRLSDLWRNIDRTIDFWIQAYTLINKSVLFIQTEFGIFTLDLESAESKGWERKDTWGGARSVPFGGGPFFVIGNDDGLCLTSWGLYVVTKEEGISGFFHLVESSFGDCKVLPAGRTITRVDDGDDGCNFCILQAGLHRKTNRKTNLPQLIIDVLCCDPVSSNANAAVRIRSRN